mmetsp:Transcript_12150/g.36901  ORF Transcript_12150/g.36901 Transcript_12150/m.36901 type:complete len:261 (+) Transcript_12150:809-1591(+)
MMGPSGSLRICATLGSSAFPSWSLSSRLAKMLAAWRRYASGYAAVPVTKKTSCSKDRKTHLVKPLSSSLWRCVPVMWLLSQLWTLSSDLKSGRGAKPESSGVSPNKMPSWPSVDFVKSLTLWSFGIGMSLSARSLQPAESGSSLVQCTDFLRTLKASRSNLTFSFFILGLPSSALSSMMSMRSGLPNQAWSKPSPVAPSLPNQAVPKSSGMVLSGPMGKSVEVGNIISPPSKSPTFTLTLMQRPSVNPHGPASVIWPLHD